MIAALSLVFAISGCPDSSVVPENDGSIDSEGADALGADAGPSSDGGPDLDAAFDGADGGQADGGPAFDAGPVFDGGPTCSVDPPVSYTHLTLPTILLV